VVLRERKQGRRVEVLLVHRPRHDDWSLPKGRRRPDETPLACALREVWEETGLECRAGLELPTVRYRDALGRRREARYWAMAPVGGGFEPTHEVDEVRWVRFDRVAEHLTHRRELIVVRGLRVVSASAA
jgi:8-oxo-dGTP diphosphatase